MNTKASQIKSQLGISSDSSSTAQGSEFKSDKGNTYTLPY